MKKVIAMILCVTFLAFAILMPVAAFDPITVNVPKPENIYHDIFEGPHKWNGVHALSWIVKHLNV